MKPSLFTSPFRILRGLFLLPLLLAACSNLSVPSALPPRPAGGTPTPALPGSQPTPSAVTASLPTFGDSIKFERISVEQGLSNSAVTDILQDRYGFIWIATRDGLNRFDGYSFVTYKFDPLIPTSLSNNTIQDLFEDQQGRLWVGTAGGLNRFDRQRNSFTRFTHDPANPASLSHDSVSKIFQDSAGDLWVGTLGGGLDRLDPSVTTFTHFRNDPNNPQSLSSNIVGCLYEDTNGTLWVSTWNGLDTLDRTTGTFTHFGEKLPASSTLQKSYVRSILQDRNGILWIGTAGNGVDTLNLSTGEFRHFGSDAGTSGSLSDNDIQSIYEDAAGVIWIATANGLNQYLPQSNSFHSYTYQNETPENPESLSAALVSVIYQDRSGLYWVGTDHGGINTFSVATNRFAHYRHSDDLAGSISNNSIWAIYQDWYGSLWVGTSHGLSRAPATGEPFTYYFADPTDPQNLSNDWIRAILQDEQGTIWAATDRGLNYLNGEHAHFIPYNIRFQGLFDKTIDLNQVSLNTLYQAPGGDLWMGSNSFGLLRFNSKLNQIAAFYPDEANPTSLSGSTVLSITADTDGYLWVGTLDKGLNRYDPQSGAFTRFTSDTANPASLSSNTVYALHQDSNGALWAGTANGLNRYDPATGGFTAYHEKDGLPAESVYCILEDDLHNLWISTSRGISRFNPINATFKNFDRRDGLQGNEFNPGACFKGASGKLYFGGDNGFNVFIPSLIYDNSYVPPVALTSLTQNGESIPLQSPPESLQEVTIYWPRNYFEFEFSALSFIQANKNQYAYRLEGFEEDWNWIGTNHSGRYTNLPGGTYTLHLYGSNNDGVWSDTGFALKVTIVPPFWEMPLFFWLALGGAVILLFGGYTLRVRGIQNRNRELERQVSERTYEIEQRRQVAEGLRDVLILLNSNHPLEESLDQIACQAHNLIKADKTCLFQIRGAAGVKIITSYSCETDDTSEATASPVNSYFPDRVLQWFSELVKDQEPHLFANLPEQQRRNPTLSDPAFNGMRTLLVLPIVSGGDVFGGMAVLFAAKKEFSTEDQELLSSFADQAALAVGNAQLRAKAEELAVVSERTRLARELHDAVTQTLFSASLIAEAIPAVWEVDHQEADQLLRELRQLSRGALAEMRTLLLELRPAALTEARLPNLIHQLTEAVTSRTRLKVTLDLKGGRPLPQDVHIGLYRIAQEATTNVVKHAQASELTVRLRFTPQSEPNHYTVLLEICDNGRGFDAEKIPPDHFGVRNIRERAEAIGAAANITSAPGAGTTIQVIWQGEVPRND